MSTSLAPSIQSGRRLAVSLIAGSSLIGSALLVGSVAERADAATAVDLGTAQSFSVLAGSGITNTGPTTLFGDLGTFPTTTVTGAADITIGGTNHQGDAVTQSAKNDLVTAYNTAKGALPPTLVTADLGGMTLVPGIYQATSAMGLTGALTLDAGGDPSAVFIFQAGSTLTAASNSSITLLNDAQACNIFWQVGSSATIGTDTAFRGNILAYTSITADTDATFEGRLLASNGAVTLHSNVVTRPGCATKLPPGGGTGTTPPTTGGGGTGTVPPNTGGGTGAGGTGTTLPTTSPGAGDTGNSAGSGTNNAGNRSDASSDNLPDTGGTSPFVLGLGLLLLLLGTIAIMVGRIKRHKTS